MTDQPSQPTELPNALWGQRMPRSVAQDLLDAIDANDSARQQRPSISAVFWCAWLATLSLACVISTWSTHQQLRAVLDSQRTLSHAAAERDARLRDISDEWKATRDEVAKFRDEMAKQEAHPTNLQQTVMQHDAQIRLISRHMRLPIHALEQLEKTGR